MKKTLLNLSLLLLTFSISAQVTISFEASEGYTLGVIDSQGATGNEWSLLNATATDVMDVSLATVANNRAVTGINSLRFISDSSQWGYYGGVLSPLFTGYDNAFIVTHKFYPDSASDSDYLFQIFDFDGTALIAVATLRFDWQGTIDFTDGTTLNSNVGTYTAGQWYEVQIERTLTNIILRVNGTQLASYPNFGTGTSAKFIGIRFDNYGSGFNIDDLTLEVSASSSSFVTNSISVYPNPATTLVNLSNTENLIFENVTIVDVNGRIVKTVAINLTQTQINVSDLTSGIYFLNIETNEGSTVKKFIKN
jgi:hypothetical protein